MLVDHEQSLLQELGREACYMLVVKRMAELETNVEFNPVLVYRYSVSQKWAQPNCLLLSSEEILSWLTGKRWQKLYVAIGQVLPNGTKYLATRYTKKTGSAVLQHFVLWSPQLIELYNPLDVPFSDGWAPESMRAFIPVAQRKEA